VTVTSVDVTVIPPSTISVGQTAQCEGVVHYSNGSSDTNVRWLASGGTISSNGLITPPPVSGTYACIAESNVDPSKSGSANITVTPTTTGSGTITVESVSAADPSVPVPASWSLDGDVPGLDVCAATGVACSGTGETYTGLPANDDPYILSDASTTDPGYTSYTVVPADTQTLTLATSAATFLIEWNAPSTPYYSCSGSGGSCALDLTCTSPGNGCYANDSTCGSSCGGGGSTPLSATLTADPTSGIAPLNVTLTATASGGTASTFNYLFWSDCSYSGSSSTEAIAACGNPFKEDDATTTLSDVAATTYSTSGTFTPFVIVEAGSGSSAPASAEASASLSVTGSSCTSGATTTCTAATGNFCGLTSPGMAICSAGGTWGTCTPPPDSACGYVCSDPTNGTCKISSNPNGVSQSACESTCVPGPSVTINYFTATPGRIPAGGLSLLTWSASNADSCIITDQNGSTTYSGSNTSSSIPVYPNTTMVYTLVCSNSASNGSASVPIEQTVTVSPVGIHEGQ